MKSLRVLVVLNADVRGLDVMVAVPPAVQLFDALVHLDEDFNFCLRAERFAMCIKKGLQIHAAVGLSADVFIFFGYCVYWVTSVDLMSAIFLYR